MAKLTVERLLEVIEKNSDLSAIFDGSANVETKRNRHHIVPSGYAVTEGGVGTSTISQMQAFRDGNAFNLAETATNPGIDISIYFDNVSSFQTVTFSAKYCGTSTHYLYIQLYDVMAGAWRTIWDLNHDANRPGPRAGTARPTSRRSCRPPWISSPTWLSWAPPSGPSRGGETPSSSPGSRSSMRST